MESKALLFLSIFLISSLFGTLSFSQQKSVMMFNSRGLDPDRYIDIKGSPYMFENWKYGKTVNSNSEIIDSLEINYNGYTHNVEIRKGGTYIELDAYHYPLVVVYNDESGKEIFLRRNSSQTLLNRYTRLVFSGLEFMVVEDFNTRIETKRVNDVGVIRESQTFVSKKNYFIIHENKSKLIKMKKDALIKLLGNEGELDNYLKKTKNKLKTEEDMVALFKFFDKEKFIYK